MQTYNLDSEYVLGRAPELDIYATINFNDRKGACDNLNKKRRKICIVVLITISIVVLITIINVVITSTAVSLGVILNGKKQGTFFVEDKKNSKTTTSTFTVFNW